MADTFVIEYVVTEADAERALAAILAARKLPQSSTRREKVQEWTVVGLLFAGTLFYMVVTGFIWWVSITPLLPVVLAAALVIHWNLHRRLRAGIHEQIQRLGTLTVRWTLSEENMSSERASGNQEILWADISEVFFGHGFWVVTEKNRMTTLLPVSSLSESAERYFLSRVRDAGATIRLPDSLKADYDDERR